MGKTPVREVYWFNGYKTDKTTGEKVEYCYEKYKKYEATDFSRFK